jgi:HSP20 family molecular chaperone IbpA
VDLTQADTETLEVYYYPDRIHLSATISDRHVWERDVDVPSWANSKASRAVINNRILTVTTPKQ